MAVSPTKRKTPVAAPPPAKKEEDAMDVDGDKNKEKSQETPVIDPLQVLLDGPFFF